MSNKNDLFPVGWDEGIENEDGSEYVYDTERSENVENYEEDEPLFPFKWKRKTWNEKKCDETFLLHYKHFHQKEDGAVYMSDGKWIYPDGTKFKEKKDSQYPFMWKGKKWFRGDCHEMFQSYYYEDTPKNCFGAVYMTEGMWVSPDGSFSKW